MSETDQSLIAEFNARRSEEAFAALVRLHVHLIFATAVRQVGDSGAAEEITQRVFVALAQAAGKLGSHPTISGWLHQTTLNKSREWLRSELRRRRREQVAIKLDLARAEGDSVWSPLVPLLDEALLELREPDRQAVILHFMEGQTFQEVGSVLGVGEDAARKRVHRCLDELTHFFRRRGFAAPAIAAGAPLFALSSRSAPAGLAASATTAGLAAAHSAASTSTLTLIKGALKIMAWTKAKTAVAAIAAVVLATGTTTLVVEKITTPTIDEALWNPDYSNFKKAPPVALVRRSKPGESYRFVSDSIGRMRIIARSAAPDFLFAFAYGFVQTRTILPKELAAQRLDALLTLPDRQQEALRRELEKKLGYMGKPQIVETDVLLLKIKSPEALRLTITTGANPVKVSPNNDQVVLKDRSMANLAATLEQRFEKPVLDRTGLTNRYDLTMPNLLRKTKDGYGVSNETARPELQQMLDETGLELVPGHEPIEMLVVEKAR